MRILAVMTALLALGFVRTCLPQAVVHGLAGDRVRAAITMTHAPLSLFRSSQAGRRPAPGWLSRCFSLSAPSGTISVARDLHSGTDDLLFDLTPVPVAFIGGAQLQFMTSLLFERITHG